MGGKRKKVSERTGQPAKHKKGINWSTQFLFTNPKSSLVATDLSALLTRETWELLDFQERQECLALLPDVDKRCLPDGTFGIDDRFFAHNVFLQDSLREFQEDLADGLLMPGKRQKTIQASIDRAAGKADAFKEARFEQIWGERLSSG